MPDLKRLFIAFHIVPSETWTQELTNIRKHLQFENIGWTNPAQMHCTLKFLGETSAARIHEIGQAMTEAFSESKIFDVQLKSLGVFGSAYKPRVLWVGLEPLEAIKDLFFLLKIQLEKLGFEYDRQNFVPHITLGRIKSVADKESLRKLVDEYKNFCFQESRIGSIVLYESILHPQGPEYVECFKVALSNN